MEHRFRGRTTLLLHHTGKDGSQRGTSKREDTPETVLKLKKVKREERDDIGENESVFKLEFSKGRESFGLDEEPLTLRLTTQGGKARWSYTTVRTEQEAAVARALAQGIKQTDIAMELGVTKQRISRIVRKLREQAAASE